jgi:hypothetical protein
MLIQTTFSSDQLVQYFNLNIIITIFYFILFYLFLKKLSDIPAKFRQIWSQRICQMCTSNVQ